MPQYVAPNSDISRLTFMNRAIRTAASAQTAGEQILDAALLADEKMDEGDETAVGGE